MEAKCKIKLKLSSNHTTIQTMDYKMQTCGLSVHFQHRMRHLTVTLTMPWSYATKCTYMYMHLLMSGHDVIINVKERTLRSVHAYYANVICQ